MDGSSMQLAAKDPAEQTPAMLSGRVAALERDRAAAEAELVRVIAERRTLAPAANGPDRAAAAQAAARIGWLNARHAELVMVMDNLSAGASIASEKLGETLEARQRGCAVRHADPVALARAIVAQAARVDDALAALADALAARQALARRLAGLGSVSLRAMQSPARIRGAVAHHGAAGWLELGRGLDRLHAPLRDADEMILHHLLKPATRAVPVPHVEKETAA